MAPEPSNRTRRAASYNRRRAENACVVCRARKTRCDNQRPVCGFCAATGGECQYADSDPARFDRASLAILQRLSELESRLVSHIDESLKEPQVNSLATGDGRAAQLTDSSDHPSTTTSGHFSSNLHNNATDLGPETVIDLHEDAPPSSKALLQSSKMCADSILKWPIFTQAAPHLEKELQTPIMEVFAQADTTVTASNKGASMMNLESEWINRLVENFLTHNHVKNPILDVDLLRSYARDFGETGPQWDEKSCLMVSEVRYGREITELCVVDCLCRKLHFCTFGSRGRAWDLQRPNPAGHGRGLFSSFAEADWYSTSPKFSHRCAVLFPYRSVPDGDLTDSCCVEVLRSSGNTVCGVVNNSGKNERDE
jgi:Fungal Zn(2)-Cys(6) binuclear cluster domain